ncbi:uncharacterized protein LOC127796020 [Diospyros lotus]|uniref:uncharacterized protein LOC127796020 n=1 Tax=Diospyros lotus TaxID=55363 RepID=UPI00224F6DF2|nr:uncharacterized protein LOC127796020 [Diospyros lotus]
MGSADERLTALSKAYAEMIMNTGREAAARIMVSERKAVRFQKELSDSKEQALQVLLRLRGMMDSKVSESQMSYLSQQRKIEELEGRLREAEDIISEAEEVSSNRQLKIEELEAQLAEAEDIVKDLREELREVQDELEDLRNKKLQHIGEHDTAIQEQTLDDNRSHACQSIIFPPPASKIESVTISDLKNSTLNQRNEVYNCYNSNVYHAGASYIGKPDLPSTSENRLTTSCSIISPPPELQFGPFTASEAKGSASNKRNEVDKCRDTNDLPMANSHVSKPDLLSAILKSKGPELHKNRRTLRIRAFEEKLMAGELPFSERMDDVYEMSTREARAGERIYKTPSHKVGKMHSINKKCIAKADSRSKQAQKAKSSCQKRKRATRYEKTDNPPSRFPFNMVERRDQTSDISLIKGNSVNNNADSGRGPIHITPRLSADTADNDTQFTEVTGCEVEFMKAGVVHSIRTKNQASIDKLLLMRPESVSAESSEVATWRVGMGKVDVPIVNSEMGTSSTPNRISNQPVTNRVIKYTFQRKRKKGSQSSSNVNAALEKSIFGETATEKQNDPLEIEKSSSITESSQGNRHI